MVASELPGEPDKSEQSKTTNVELFRSRFGFIHVSDIIKTMGVQWVIDEITETGALGYLFGDPASYKSFMALDWALCIASGTQWKGHMVKHGPVFMLIGEGHSGYAKRVAAWSKSTGRYVDDSPVYISTAPVQVLNFDSAKIAAEEISKLQTQHGQPALVVLDTLTRNFGPGDENSTADMTKFIAGLDWMMGNQSTRLLVHHSGHSDKSRGRGSSALRGAVDAEYMIERKNDAVTLSCHKMKDAQEFKPMKFNPEIVPIGGKPDDPITSLYLSESNDYAKQMSRVSPQMRDSLKLLDLMNRKSGISCSQIG